VPTLDVIDLYDKLRLAPDETERARLIAHAFAELEQRYPQLDEIVTTRALSETELRLIKEIEQVRAELKETELKLSKEIEQVRAELKETELKLSKEIEQVRAELKETELKLSKEIEQVRAELKVEIARSHASLLKWSFLFWASQLGAILLLAWRLFGHS
jgi:septal ring factor EnvC (AmiA/AmiB activator)